MRASRPRSGLLLTLLLTATTAFAQSPKDKLLGAHNMRLQWVHFDNASRFGKAIFTEKDGVVTLKGDHRNAKGNYVTVEGSVTNITATNFTLEGKVITRVDYIFEGKPCERKGKFLFRLSGARPYYRMREMENPCDTATDYVDIYVAKLP